MSFHDEPLVFDNGPFGVDIGNTHASRTGLFEGPTGTSPQTWVRNASITERILVLVKKNGGDPDLFRTDHVDTSKPVTLTLKEPGAMGDTATVTLTWDPDTESNLTIAASGIELSQDGRRLKSPGGSPLRIAEIKWNDNETVTLFNGGNPRHESVFVALF